MQARPDKGRCAHATNKIIEGGLLLLALLPMLLLALMAVRIWAFGAPIELWQAPAWALYGLQVLALFAFALHVLDNKELEEGQSGRWLWEIALYHQIAMLSYWEKHVWAQPHR